MIKFVGAILVIAGGGSFGFLIAGAYKNEIKVLRQFLFALEHMKGELQFRLTPLPDLFKEISSLIPGCLSNFFCVLATELESQIRPDVASCVKAALLMCKDIPSQTRKMIDTLGLTLGRFDLNGQLQNIDALHVECTQKLSLLINNQDVRIRSYQTLGLCAGAAMAIVLI